MARVFSGLNVGLGIVDSRLGGSGEAKCGRAGGSLYVNAANGNLVLTRQDGFLSDGLLSGAWGEAYNSSDGAFRFGFQSKLWLNGAPHQKDSTLVREGLDGHRVSYYYDVKASLYRALDGSLDTIALTKDGFIFKEAKTDIGYCYDNAGKLNRIEDKAGRHVTFTYLNDNLSAVIDSTGRQTIEWQFDKGQLISVKQTSDGTLIRAYRYQYDSQNRLTAMIIAKEGGDYTVNYSYVGDTHLLAAITETDGESWTFAYDSQSRLIGLNASGHMTRYVYGEHYTQVIEANNQTWTYYYDDKARLTGLRGPNGLEYAYQYTNNYLSQVTQGTAIWTYDYNDAGDCIAITKPNHLIIRYTYDDAHHCLKETHVDLQDQTSLDVWQYHYDEHGFLRDKINANGVVTGYEYDASGHCIKMATYENRDTYAKGQALTSTEYSYDFRGLLSQTREHDGDTLIITDTIYDASGRLIDKVKGKSHTHYVYDALDRLIIESVGGTKRVIDYQDAAQKIIETDALGRQIVSLYDKGQKIYQEIIDGGMSYQTLRYEYDALNRLIKTTDALNREAIYRYDDLGRLSATIDVEHRVTYYQYDERGNHIATIKAYEKSTHTQLLPNASAKDHITRFTYNEANECILEETPITTIGYRYDKEGRLIEKSEGDRHTYYQYTQTGLLSRSLDATGLMIGYRYNAEGACIETIYYDTQQSLDDFLKDTPKTSLNDAHHIDTYNSLNQKISTLSADGYLTTYTYNQEGLLQSSTRYYSKPQNGAPIAHPNDETITYDYDERGNLILENHQNGASIIYRYNDANLCIEKSTQSADMMRKQCFRYDAMGRVSASLAPKYYARINNANIDAIWDKYATHFSYDAAGRLIEKRQGEDSVTSFIYDDENFTVYQISPEGSVIKTVSNALGQVITETKCRLGLGPTTSASSNTHVGPRPNLQLIKPDPQDQITQFTYNDAGQLIKKEQGTLERLYTYNNYGELESKQEGTHLHHYQYDNKGQVIEDTIGPCTHHYRYNVLGDVIEDQDNQSTQYYRYDTNHHLIEKKDALNHIKTYAYDAYGRLTFESRNLAPTSQGQTPTSRGLSAGTSYAYDDQTHTIKTFDANHALIATVTFDAFGDKVSITDGNQNMTTYTYNESFECIKETNAKGQDTQFDYDEYGHLTLKQTAHTKTCWQYDKDQRLTLITEDPDGLNLTTTYQYDALNRIMYKKDPNGSKTAFSYDVNNNLIKRVLDADNLALTTCYTYDENQQVTKIQVLNPEGKDKITAFEYDEMGRKIANIESPDDLNLITRFIYDENNNLIQSISPNNTSTYYGYDANHQCVFKLDALGFVTTFEYNDNNEEIARCQHAYAITPGLYSLETLKAELRLSDSDRYTGLKRDDTGKVTLKINPDGRVESYKYDLAGNCIETRSFAVAGDIKAWLKSEKNPPSGSGRDTLHIYNALNQETFTILPIGRVIEFIYNEQGLLIDKRQFGNMLNMSDIIHDHSEANVRAHMNYDAKKDNHTQYRYDSIGRLIEETYVDKKTTYIYDKTNNLIEKREQSLNGTENARVTYALYDGAGRNTYQISANGRVLKKTYDANNNVIQETTYLEVYTGLKTQAALAAWVAPTSVNRYRYDSNERLLEKTNANQASMQNSWDMASNLIKKTDENGQTWTYHYDVLNRLIEKTSPKILVSTVKDGKLSQQLRCITDTYAYNAFGDCITAIKDKGYAHQEKHFTYDAMSRLTQTISQHSTDTRVYNAFGELIEATDKLGNKTHYVYNFSGDLQYEVNGMHEVKLIGHNNLAQVTFITRYVNRILPLEEYTSLTVQRAVLADANDRRISYTYDLAGRVISEIKPVNLVYNPETEYYAWISPETQYTYNAFGELIQKDTSINNEDWGVITQTFDDEGRLISKIDEEDFMTTYRYDVVGNLIETYAYALQTSDDTPPETTSKDRKITYEYDSLNRLIYKTNGSHLSYDALGNLVQETNARGDIFTYEYNALNQLISKTSPKTAAGIRQVTYGFDGLAHCVMMQTANHLNLDEYDNEDHHTAHIDGVGTRTHYEYDDCGQLIKSWLEGAIKDERINTYDKVGRLIEITRQVNKQTVTERMDYNAFGELTEHYQNDRLLVFAEYDKLGRVWRSHKLGVGQVYAYDFQDRLVQVVSVSEAFTTNYGRDGIDINRKIISDKLSYRHPEPEETLMYQDTQYDKKGNIVFKRKDTYIPFQDTPTFKRVSESYTVDAFGNTLTHTNARGFTTHYVYDDNNRLIQQTFPEVTILDAKGIAKTIKPTLSYAYDAIGNLIATTDAAGHTKQYRFDANQNMIEEIDALNHSKTYGYDLENNRIQTKDAKDQIITYEYDANRRLTKVKTPNTIKTYEYDTKDHIIHQTLGDEHIYYTLDEDGHLLKKTDTSGQVTRYEYNNHGEKIKETDGNLHNQTWDYDNLGRMLHRENLGGVKYDYEYNTNNRITGEKNTKGRSIHYYYSSDGLITSVEDVIRHEVMRYQYDDVGNMIQKKSSRAGEDSTPWPIEVDYYVYDAMNRLQAVRRKRPSEESDGMPDADNAILAIDYSYDETSNVRRVQTRAKYDRYTAVSRDEWYAYDETNRIMVNKGILENGVIGINAHQGTKLSYDANSNISEANTYASNKAVSYQYTYDEDNRLVTIAKDNKAIEAKAYDKASRVVLDKQFDANGHVTTQTIMMIENGLLRAQVVEDSRQNILSKTTFAYDNSDNLETQTTTATSANPGGAYTLTHKYTYLLADGYLLSKDNASLSIKGRQATYGESERLYDVNYQLSEVIDKQKDTKGMNNDAKYWVSVVEGIKAKRDKEGLTSYLFINGQTIGDVRLNENGSETLNVYSGFSPNKSQAEETTAGDYVIPSWANTAPQAAPEIPETNTGGYVIQSGDTLESIALMVYGDKSLWYVIADANGLSDKDAVGGEGLRVGLRLTLPSITTHHYTSDTRNVMNAADYISDSSATTPVPPPPAKKHHFLSKIVVDIWGLTKICNLKTMCYMSKW